MATSPYTIANKAILDRELQEEAWQKTVWSKFAKFATKLPGRERWEIPQDAPISIYKDFITEGRNHMLFPLVRNLQNLPKVGEQTLKSNTEDLRFLWRKLFVHLTRHGEKLPSKVSYQNIKWSGLAKRYMPLLADWWSRWENHEVTRSLYEGFSYAITLAAGSGGLAQTVRYPKNILVWDGSDANFTTNAVNSGSYTVSTGYTATQIATAFGAADTSADYLTTSTLEAALPEIYALNIDPIVTENGNEFFAVVINSRQAKTLRQDVEWLRATASGMPRGWDNPIFSGAIGKWDKFVIYVDDVVARLPYYSGSTLDFFTYTAGSQSGTSSNGYNGIYAKPQAPTPIATGTQNIACAHILGKNCISKGIAEVSDEMDETIRMQMGIRFAKDVDDFGMVKEIGSEQFYGYARNDFFDEEVGGGTSAGEDYNANYAMLCTAVS